MFKRKKNKNGGSLKGFAPTTDANANANAINTSTGYDNAKSTGTNGSAGRSSLHDAAIDMTSTTANNSASTNDSETAVSFLESLNDTDVIERVRTTIKHSHVFKLPTRQSGSIGWRGADWKEKVWHGTVKVVDRGSLTAVLLVDSQKNTIFAVCPIKEGLNSVERCVDSSRYFVLRIENQLGRHMFIGLAFNERNDAFDFNTAMQDAKKERDFELNGHLLVKQEMNDFTNTDYSLKKGEKIKVNIPKKHSEGTHSNMNMTGNALEDSKDGQSQSHGTMAFAHFQSAAFDGNDYSPDKSSMEGTSPSTPSAPASVTANKSKARESTGSATGGFMLKPSKKDTPARTH
jgi:hypothetical protein